MPQRYVRRGRQARVRQRIVEQLATGCAHLEFVPQILSASAETGCGDLNAGRGQLPVYIDQIVLGHWSSIRSPAEK
jgi:hypothetical protein